MRKHMSKHLIAILLVIVLVATMVSFTGSLVAVADSGSYYASITATSGQQLLGQLHDLITTTHKTYTRYDDCKNPYYVKQTDPGSNGSYVMEFYSQADISQNWGGGKVGTWNREHVWCQSLSNGMWGETGGGADMHHIRPAESSLNSTRGNDKYGDAGKQNPKYYKDSNGKEVAIGGWISGGVFEPLDAVKGDVARIVMYVYTHYNTYSNVGGTTNGSGSSGYFGTLHFTNVVNAKNEEAAIKLLLQWNELDPVDDIERTRNEAVYKIQGNRNPFIDNPDYANAIWGGTILPDVELESITLDPTSLELSVGQTNKIAVSAHPANADATVEWSSSDESIATISSLGFVTAISEGTTVITATSVENSEITASATVTVKTKSTTPDESGYITINQASFDMTANYSFKNWTSGDIGGIAYIYGGNTTYPISSKDGLQFNISKDSYYIASNVATPSAIKSITVVMVEGKADRLWKLLTSDEAYGEVKGKPTNGTDHGTKTVNSQGVTWELDGCTDTYFALTCEEPTGKSAASYIESIVIEYGESGGSEVVTPESLEITPNSVTLDITNATVEAIKNSITVEVVYSDNSKKVADSYDLSGFDGTKKGEQAVTVTCGDLKATITVTVEGELPPDVKPERLEITPNSVTLEKANATIETIRNTISVAVVYTGDSKVQADSYDLIGFNPEQVGEQTVTINCCGLEGTITVVVNEEPPAPPTPAEVEEFIQSVEAIAESTTRSEKYEKIANAIEKYNQLSDELKENNQEVNSAFATLQNAVNTYNQDVEAINTASEKATENGLLVCLTVFASLGAVIYLLKRKLF